MEYKTNGSNNSRHTALVNKIIFDLQSPSLRLEKNPRGQATAGAAVYGYGPGGQSCATIQGPRQIRFGFPVPTGKGVNELEGSDLIGLCGPAGQFVAIECKTGSSKLKKGQREFLKFVQKFGGRAGIAWEHAACQGQGCDTPRCQGRGYTLEWLL